MRPLLLDAVRVKRELLFGFCHPSAYTRHPAAESTGVFAPEFLFSIFLPIEKLTRDWL